MGKTKEKHQFFLITFRADLLEHVDKFFEVRFFGRYSHVRNISAKQAENVVTMALREEEKRNQGQDK